MKHTLILSSLLFATVSAYATDPVQFDYMMNCQGCHLPDGSGFPARNVPTITGQLGNFLHVEGGREFLVRVPGSAQSDLNDERLAAVLNWMLNTFSPAELPAQWQPYSAEEVGLLRKSPLLEVTPIRSQLMGRIAALNANKTVTP